MKVLLLKDVYKLGRAGDVKKVADGFGRNYLIRQGLAVMATPGSLKQASRIRKTADENRIRLNQELGVISERINGLELAFPVKAGEAGKLYGSITTTMIAERIEQETGAEVDRRQVDTEPIKMLGVHKASVRLTIDLIPEITILVHREGEPPESAFAEEEAIAEAEKEKEIGESKAEGATEPESENADITKEEAETQEDQTNSKADKAAMEAESENTDTAKAEAETQKDQTNSKADKETTEAEA